MALSAVQICKHIFSSTYTGITVSTMMHGEYGLDDICLSVLTAVGPGGVRAHLHADLSEEEIQKLHHSADCLRAVMNQIKVGEKTLTRPLSGGVFLLCERLHTEYFKNTLC